MSATTIERGADGRPILTVEQVAAVARLSKPESRSHGDGLAILRELWRVSKNAPGDLMCTPIIEWAAGVVATVEAGSLVPPMVFIAGDKGERRTRRDAAEPTVCTVLGEKAKVPA